LKLEAYPNAISPSRLSDVIDTVTSTEIEEEKKGNKDLFFIFVFVF